MFDRLVGQAVELGHKQIGIFLNGEPMLFPRLFDWLQRLRDRKLTTPIFTNGNALTEEKARRLAEYSDVVATVVFSLAGVDAESYRQIMGLDYATVRRRVEFFLSVSNGRIKAYAHMPLFSLSEPFAQEWRQHWGQLLHASPTAMFNWAGLVSDPRELQENSQLRRQACQRLCHLAVLWNGRTALCCMDLEGAVSAGDANTEKLADIYAGPLLAKYRELHGRGEYGCLALCDRCNMNIVG